MNIEVDSKKLKGGYEMKWNKAVEKIEAALAEEKKVEITYHIKYNRKIYYTDTVESVHEYDYYDGKQYKTVITYHDGLDEVRNIIDEVKVME